MLVFEDKMLEGNSANTRASLSQYNEMLSQRRVFTKQNQHFVDLYGNQLTAEQRSGLEANAGKPALDFWRETDRVSIQVKDNDQGRELAVLVAATSALKEDTALTPDTAGRLKVAVVGTDAIVAYSQETYTVGAAPELVKVRFA